MSRPGLFGMLCALSVFPLAPVAAQNLLWACQNGTSSNESGRGVAVDVAGSVYVAGSTAGSLGGPYQGMGDAFLAKHDASGSLLWTRQLGTSAGELCRGVAVDGAGNAYVTGETYGNLDGLNAGIADAFLAKYDASGGLLWTRQIGTSGNEESYAVAVDGAGNAYITGLTTGNLGAHNAGGQDVFLAKFDPSGALLWVRQTGTSNNDFGEGLAVDSAGNSYIAGGTLGGLVGTNAGAIDAFLMKYDSSGVWQWTRQFGTLDYEEGSAVAVDSAGSVTVTGYTGGALGGANAGGNDAFVARFDASGTPLWTRQVGTSANDYGFGVGVDGAGHTYITGYTQGSLGGTNAGNVDAFLAEYDGAGSLLWTRQLGTSESESSYGAAVDGAGNVTIAGYTYGSLGGANAGGSDYFVAKYGAAENLLWTRQAGTSMHDEAFGVAVDGAGNLYVGGVTLGSLGGPSAGGWDVFLAKYNAAGLLLWTRQIGTPTDEEVGGVAVDGAGNAYITGTTTGSLGGPNAGLTDAYLIKYSSSGDLLWARQIGTSTYDSSLGIAADAAGNAYLTGTTQGSLGGASAGVSDIFLVKYDPSGALLWTRQIGTTTSEGGSAVAVDGAGNAYVAGATFGSLGGANAGGGDVVLIKYDSSGALLWTRQTGTTDLDAANGVAVDGAGSVLVTGYTRGSLGGTNSGIADCFLAKYDASGTPLWTRQLGTPAIDYSLGVGVDGAGSAYIAGYTVGDLGGTSAGFIDAFVAKYDRGGALLWARQFGTSGPDPCEGLAVDAAGNAFLTGYTNGNLGGPNAGGSDYFLAKFGPGPCPADFDGDGFVTGDDFDFFVSSFEGGLAEADFDSNGFVTGEDFDAYVAAFEAGC